MKAQSSRLEILIVEDSPTQAAYLKNMLEEHDFAVTAVSNGREALESLRRHKPTLVITDITMPEIDGYELCRRIRADEQLAELPVILLTALSDPEDVFKGLECGADNFITKPYEQGHLLARIHYLLANLHLRLRENVQASMEVFLAGRRHVITSDRAQILNLLLSTYETAVQKNRELSKARDDLTKVNEQLEAANRDLESFCSSVSHDLRAPLRGIGAFSSDLARDYAALLPPDGLVLLEQIISNVQRMTQIVEDLLRLSQLGRRKLSKGPVNMSQIVADVVNELRLEQGVRQVRVQVGNLPDCVGDSSLLKQVLFNLLANAFKFTRLRELAVIEVGAQQQNGENIYFVRDNGAGFDMTFADKLFGVFERLHTEKEFEGTGVGLSIVQRIVQRHGGRVWADSQPDKGAVFYFTLPG